MKEIVKKVLSYIGVASLGALIGIGSLIGVSSCSQQDNNTQVKAKVNKKALGSYSDYYVPKSADFFGATYTQNQTTGIYLDQSIIQEDLEDYVAWFYYYGSFIFYDEPDKIYPRLQFSFYLNKVDSDNCSIKLRLLQAIGNGTKDIYVGSSSLYVPYLIESHIDSAYQPNVNYFSENYLGGVFDFYFNQLGEPSFTFEFAKQINYNSPYGWDISSTFVYDSYFDSSHLVKVFTYDMPYFLSGGFIFNQIKVYFSDALASSYYDTEGNRQVFQGNYFCYYQQMEYVNTRSSFSQVVNKRDMLAWSSGNDSGFALTRTSNWISSDFKKLEFFEVITPQSKLVLNQFNNNQYGDSFAISQPNNNVGLGSAFGLISQAFTAWLPILSTTIVPGITLGLLLFLPLIAGIIIFIIWIVKR